jgi:hypothetical protein
MNVDQIRLRVREDFRPFALVTSSGHKYAVPHPDSLFLTQRTVIVAEQHGYATQIDPLHIVGIEDVPERRNGGGRRRKRG